MPSPAWAGGSADERGVARAHGDGEKAAENGGCCAGDEKAAVEEDAENGAANRCCAGAEDEQETSTRAWAAGGKAIGGVPEG